MPKYPESQALFTRLLIEAGFRKKCGQFDKKRFCQETGISPRMYCYYRSGESKLSTEKLKELARNVGLTSFNIL
jgi:transcriptional regulator with XRE-family HTH domain